MKELIDEAHGDLDEDTKLRIYNKLQKELLESINKMCASCGVEWNKYGVRGLWLHILDKFYHEAVEAGMWDIK